MLLVVCVCVPVCKGAQWHVTHPAHTLTDNYMIQAMCRGYRSLRLAHYQSREELWIWVALTKGINV